MLEELRYCQCFILNQWFSEVLARSRNRHTSKSNKKRRQHIFPYTYLLSINILTFRIDMSVFCWNIAYFFWYRPKFPIKSPKNNLKPWWFTYFFLWLKKSLRPLFCGLRRCQVLNHNRVRRWSKPQKIAWKDSSLLVENGKNRDVLFLSDSWKAFISWNFTKWINRIRYDESKWNDVIHWNWQKMSGKGSFPFSFASCQKVTFGAVQAMLGSSRRCSYNLSATTDRCSSGHRPGVEIHMAGRGPGDCPMWMLNQK